MSSDIRKNETDITKNEVKDDAQRQTLNIIKSALELAGLNPDDYDLNLRKKSTVKAPPNIQVYQTAAYLAGTTLGPSAAKIFLYFISLSEFENYVGIHHQETISEDTGMSLRQVSRGIKELVENGIVIKSKSITDKRKIDYFLNPMTAWKGKTLSRKIALAKLQQENPNQLHLFGETYEDNIEREQEEIKKKRPNLFKLKEAEYDKKLKRENSPKISDIQYIEDFEDEV